MNPGKSFQSSLYDMCRYPTIDFEASSLLISSYPIGSQWRRWDLHVHTPCSQLGNPFSGIEWNKYVDELEFAAESSGIAVIGVTDYMSIDGYERLFIAKEENGRLKNVSLLIPNIEFRIMPNTETGKALNLHLLIDPSDPDHITKIKRSLKNLKFHYKGESYGCSRDELIEFARKQRNDFENDNCAYRCGIEQFKPDRTDLKNWLDKEAWLRSNCLIGIANGNDGISGLPLDGFGAVRDEMLCLCDFVFSGSQRDREHYLGRKSGFPPEEIIRQYGSLKPCIHGSDAHNIEKLFKPDNERFCWIKSDPTFQGLRQILWEPETRVHIGPVPPQLTDQSQLIRCISFSDTKGWFTQENIELNAGLVAVIGEKGAGKTAIAELAAFAAGVSWDKKSQSSFITKGQPYLSDVKVQLEWGNGSVTSATLLDQPHSVPLPLVRYLSQDFVERLCSSDHEGRELQKAIEDVVFTRLDSIQKEGYSSFSELRKARETASVRRRENFRGEIATLNKEIERLYQAISQRQLKVDSKNEVEKQIEDLKKQLPDATQFVDQAIFEQLQEQQSLLAGIEKDIAAKTRIRRAIEDVKQSYSLLKSKVESEVKEIQEKLEEIETKKDLIDRIPPKWDETVEKSLKIMIQTIDSNINKLKGSEKDDTENGDDRTNSQTILTVTKLIGELKEKVSEDEERRKRLLDLQKQISERMGTVERLEMEITNLDTRVKQQFLQKQTQRLEIYLEFFSALNEDEEGLRDLYAPIQQAIEKLEMDRKFEIFVGYQIDFREWLKNIGRFFDRRHTGVDEKRIEIEKFVELSLVSAWKKGEIEEIKTKFEEFVKLFDAENFLENFASQKTTLVELYDWMFSTDHISLSYKIRYNETELEYLSPGTRGIALLILYLLMDEDDTRPLIIDQPEGNLDNSSVYNQLVPYIREAKKRRQIILITHNPNLVVATDAEQVIIATSVRSSSQRYPIIEYNSGSLEHIGKDDHLGVREAVCLLLEGGEPAFKERENRYALSK